MLQLFKKQNRSMQSTNQIRLAVVLVIPAEDY